MKKRSFRLPANILFSVLLSATVFSACNNDDYSDNTTSDSLNNHMATDSSMMHFDSGSVMGHDTSMMHHDSTMMNKGGVLPKDTSHQNKQPSE